MIFIPILPAIFIFESSSKKYNIVNIRIFFGEDFSLVGIEDTNTYNINFCTCGFSLLSSNILKCFI